MNGSVSQFPPDFGGNPWAYGLALFADLLVSSLCAAHILNQAYEFRHARMVHERLGIHPPDKFDMFSPLGIYRQFVLCLLGSMLLRAFPDALWLLAWNDTSLDTANALVLFDWYCDIAALFPFCWALALTIWGWKTVNQNLALTQHIRLAAPKWANVGRAVLIAAMVLIITALMTYYRASEWLARANG